MERFLQESLRIEERIDAQERRMGGCMWIQVTRRMHHDLVHAAVLLSENPDAQANYWDYLFQQLAAL